MIKNNSTQSTYCIRLNDDEGKKKNSNKKSKFLGSPKAPSLGYMNKLMTSPITTLSSTNSSGFRGQNAVVTTNFNG